MSSLHWRTSLQDRQCHAPITVTWRNKQMNADNLWFPDQWRQCTSIMYVTYLQKLNCIFNQCFMILTKKINPTENDLRVIL